MSAADYKVEADENLRLALTSMNGYQHLTTADLIALAQVNATLELAEQQRVANLQAFADGLDAELRNSGATPESHPDQYAMLDRVADLVFEGLGLA